MSQEGNIIAIGSDSKDITVGGSSQSDAGEIKVYQKQVNTASNTMSWVQMGSAIQGTSSSEYFGRAMAISGDGKTIVTHRKVNKKTSWGFHLGREVTSSGQANSRNSGFFYNSTDQTHGLVIKGSSGCRDKNVDSIFS